MDLKDIGFYTLSDNRAKLASITTKIQRVEILLTDKCNFKCPYCRGTKVKGDIDFNKAIEYINLSRPYAIRFTGGEPTLYKHDLAKLVNFARYSKVKHIAISTNGTASLYYYLRLIANGVNDFSISLDGGCCSIGDLMSGGVVGAWNIVVENIKALSKISYVTVGMVFDEHNIDSCKESVLFADSLGVSDIRVIPSAQYNKALLKLADLPDTILLKYKILKYRIDNLKYGISIRGLRKTDTSKCPLVLDDIMIAGDYQYPCPIYFRERGEPISEISSNFRSKRFEWFNLHDCKKDRICLNNCLDVCREYNNKYMEYHKNNS